jgi:hypothetical protein
MHQTGNASQFNRCEWCAAIFSLRWHSVRHQVASGFSVFPLATEESAEIGDYDMSTLLSKKIWLCGPLCVRRSNASGPLWRFELNWLILFGPTRKLQPSSFRNPKIEYNSMSWSWWRHEDARHKGYVIYSRNVYLTFPRLHGKFCTPNIMILVRITSSTRIYTSDAVGRGSSRPPFVRTSIPWHLHLLVTPPRPRLPWQCKTRTWTRRLPSLIEIMITIPVKTRGAPQVLRLQIRSPCWNRCRKRHWRKRGRLTMLRARSWLGRSSSSPFLRCYFLYFLSFWVCVPCPTFHFRAADCSRVM